jgi:tetratricopeptide (TPR) repeat protein
MAKLLLSIALILGAYLPEAAAQVRQAPLDQVLRSRPQASAHTAENQTMDLTQHPLSGQVRAKPLDDTVKLAKPPWEYTSPMDADILEGWEARVPAPAAVSIAEPSGLTLAWELYRGGRYAASAKAFAPLTASADPSEALNARLGLAYSLIKQGRREQAISHLEHLNQKGYRPSEIRLALVHVLLQTGRWSQARDQIKRLPEGQRAAWEKRLLEARLVKEHASLNRNANADALSAFVAVHTQALARCIRPDLFHDIAIRLAAAGETPGADDLRRKLLKCPLPSDLRHGIVSELAASLPDEEALALIKRETFSSHQTVPAAAAELDRLELQILKRRMASHAPESDARARLAEDILKLAPDDPDALSALAWYRFHRGEYGEAEIIFVRLLEQDPDNPSYALGLGYARLNAGNPDQALEPLDRSRIAETPETRQLRQQVYRRQAARAYHSAQWDRTVEHAEKLLALDPGDDDAKELLAWTRYRQGRPEDARPLMEDRFAARPSPSLAAGLMGIYEAAGDEDRAYDMADRLAHGPHSDARASMGPYFFERGAPITAAQIDPNPERCYLNADSPRLEAFLYHRSKQADGKFGDLEETAIPITFAYPTALGQAWSASITPKYLSGSGGGSIPAAGRYYRFLNGAPKQQEWEDSLFVVQPEIGFAMEGRLHLEARLGSTPFNAPVDPTPTFGARVSGTDWYVDIHRCNLKDSILSYVGQKDPYSNDEWGRVTRNGITAGKTWPLEGNWWVSGAAGYDYFMGDSVWDNQAVHLDAAFGQTLLFDRDEFSFGLFFTAQHFRRNSDFYTYGHGGYYSPELMTMIGPFVRYRTAVCRDYWFDVQASAGWLHQRLDSSPFYPLFDENTAGFRPEAAAEANGEYDSDLDNKLGVNLRLQGMKLLTPHLAVGGFASIDNSADFIEWTAGVGLQIFFEPQNLFWTRKDMFREFGECSNK